MSKPKFTPRSLYVVQYGNEKWEVRADGESPGSARRVAAFDRKEDAESFAEIFTAQLDIYGLCCELDYVLGEWEAGKCSDTDFEIGVAALIKGLRPILAKIQGRYKGGADS